MPTTTRAADFRNPEFFYDEQCTKAMPFDHIVGEFDVVTGELSPPIYIKNPNEKEWYLLLRSPKNGQPLITSPDPRFDGFEGPDVIAPGKVAQIRLFRQPFPDHFDQPESLSQISLDIMYIRRRPKEKQDHE